MTYILLASLALYVGYRIGRRHKTTPAYVRGHLEGFNEGLDIGHKIGLEDGAQVAEEFVVNQRKVAEWQ